MRTQSVIIGPKEILARGRNGDFKLGGFNIQGLKTSAKFVVTVNVLSKATGQVRWGEKNKPPIQFTGKPEVLIDFFKQVMVELEAAKNGNCNWKVKDTEIECDGSEEEGKRNLKQDNATRKVE